MKKKLLIIGVLLMLCSCILATSAVGFFIFYPQYQNKQQAEIYFKNIKTIDSAKVELKKSNSLANTALQLGSLSATGDSKYTEQINTFADNSLVSLNSQLETLLQELESEQPPKPIEKEVQDAKAEIKQLSKDIDKVSGDLSYMASVTTIFADFTEEISNTTNKEFSDDPSTALTQYDSAIAEFDTTFIKYQAELDALEVPSSMKEFNGLLEQDINNRYKVLINFYREGRNLISDTINFTNNPETATTSAINEHTKKVDAFIEESKTLTSKFTYKSADYDFSLIFSYNDYSEIQERINKVEDLLSDIIKYRDETLN